MSSIVIAGDTSGSITVAAPAVAGTYTQTLPMITGTLSTLNSGTAVASTSGTSIDFTSIPANVRRITVMFSGVSTNGTSNLLVQTGSGSVTTSGYTGQANSGAGISANSTGFIVNNNMLAANLNVGSITILLLGSNTYVESGIVGATVNTSSLANSVGAVTLSGALDRVRITTVNGTDTFDAGSINILYE
jgi:hypothetical protein